MAKKPQPANIINDSCFNCRYWNRFDDSDQSPDEDISGECRRYPPKVMWSDSTDTQITALPLVEARFCCGEHKRTVN